MQLPFTAQQFFAVFSEYNVAVWPAQVVLVVLAQLAVVLVFLPRSWASAGVALILAFLWGWLAIAYHLFFFARINPLAYAFAGVSLAGALVFLWQGVFLGRLRFGWTGGTRAAAGTLFLLYALIAYPLWSWLAGHRYPSMPTFGLPCPTTIYTVGLLAFLVRPYPPGPFIVPLLWCAVGAQAAFLLGVAQDLVLIAAGAAGLVLLRSSTRRTER